MLLSNPKHHEIRVRLEKDPNGTPHAVLGMPLGGLHVGQTVSYVCDDSFSLTFPDGLLFGIAGERVISDSEVLTLVEVGQYECRCSIMPKNGPAILWSSSDPKSGGAHDVER